MAANLHNLISSMSAGSIDSVFQEQRRFVAPNAPRSFLAVYNCCLCKSLLDYDKPQQSNCGDRACSSCVEFLTVYLQQIEEKYLPCPICNDPLKPSEFFPDRAVQRELVVLVVNCPFECGWSGAYGDYHPAHVDGCPLLPLPCPHSPCSTRTARREAQRHAKECQYRRTSCQHCQKTMFFVLLEKHIMEECSLRQVACKLCGEKIIFNAIERHESEKCSKAKRACRFADFKCHHKDLGENLAKHEKEQCTDHLHLLAEFMRTVSQRLSAQEVESQSPSSSVLSRVSTLEGGVSRLGQQCSGLRAELSGVLAALQSRQSREVVGASSSTFGSSPVQSRSSTDESVVRLQRSTQELQELYSQMSVAIQTMQASSYGNVFLWRVPDLARRRRDAVLGRTISLYSAPFYTSRHGYKLCLRVYLNGDGAGQRSHLSLFVCMMRGDYDPLLSWPFRQLITLYVLSQDSREKDIKQSFKADEDSPSFCRPVTDMNVASGCPKFCLLSVLDQPAYAAQDTLYLKAVISTKGLESLSSQ